MLYQRVRTQLEQDRSLFGTIEPIADTPGRVRITPWIPELGCMRRAAMVLPREWIATVVATPHYWVSGGRPLPVVRLRLNEAVALPPDLSTLAPPPEPSAPLLDRDPVLRSARFAPPFDPAQVLFYDPDGAGVVLRASAILGLDREAAFGQAIECRTHFHGRSRLELLAHGAPCRVGITGLVPGGEDVLTLRPNVPSVHESWFWGGEVVVYHTFVPFAGEAAQGARLSLRFS